MCLPIRAVGPKGYHFAHIVPPFSYLPDTSSRASSLPLRGNNALHPSRPQVTYHMLQCIMQHLHLTKGAPPQGQAAAAGGRTPQGGAYGGAPPSMTGESARAAASNHTLLGWEQPRLWLTSGTKRW